jgi:hypothetical protein
MFKNSITACPVKNYFSVSAGSIAAGLSSIYNAHSNSFEWLKNRPSCAGLQRKIS